MHFPCAVYFTTPKPSGYYSNSVEICDKRGIRGLRNDRIYILNQKTIDVIEIFKILFPLDLKIIVYTDNFEHFFYTFRFFRNFNFIFLDSSVEATDPRTTYLEAEKRILNKYVGDSGSLKEQQSNTERNKVVSDVPNPIKSRGVELSFEPRVFESIRSSLSNPEKYLHSFSDMSSKIYRELFKGKKTHEQLKEALGHNLEKELKSLIFTSIVKAKDGNFYV